MNTSNVTHDNTSVTPALYKDRPWDLILGSICIVLGLTGLRLANDGTFWSRWIVWNSTGVPVGTAAKTRGGVRLKSTEAAVWRDLDLKKMDVSGGDMIFTGADGIAELNVEGQGKAQIAPNSLIVVQAVGRPNFGGYGNVLRQFFGQNDTGSVLQLKNGRLSLKLEKGRAPVLVQLNNRTYQLSSRQDGIADVTENSITSVDKAQIDVSEVKNGSSVRTAMPSVAPGQVLELSDQGQATLRGTGFRTLEPASGAQIVEAARNPIKFSFERLNGAPTGVTSVEVSSWENPGDVQRIPVPNGATQVTRKIAPGNLRWRVVTREGPKAHVTPWSSFTYANLAPPNVLGPINHTVVGNNVVLSWSPVSPALRTEVEYGPQGDPSKAQRLFGRSNGAEIEMARGDVVWRARTIDLAGTPSDWTAPMNLRVDPLHQQGPLIGAAPRIAAAAPTPATPKARPKAISKPGASSVVAQVVPAPVPVKEAIEILPTLENSEAEASTRLGKEIILDRISVVLAWKPIPGMASYEVTIVDASGKTVKTGITQKPKFVVELRSLRTNQYSYKVSGVLANGKSISSKLVPVRVMMSPPVLRMPKTGAELKSQRDILMTWEKTAITELYSIEISETKDFKTSVVAKQQKSNFYKAEVPKTGQYYWRVKSISEGRESPWSEVGSFLISQ